MNGGGEGQPAPIRGEPKVAPAFAVSPKWAPFVVEAKVGPVRAEALEA